MYRTHVKGMDSGFSSTEHFQIPHNASNCNQDMERERTCPRADAPYLWRTTCVKITVTLSIGAYAPKWITLGWSIHRYLCLGKNLDTWHGSHTRLIKYINLVAINFHWLEKWRSRDHMKTCEDHVEIRCKWQMKISFWKRHLAAGQPVIDAIAQISPLHLSYKIDSYFHERNSSLRAFRNKTTTIDQNQRYALTHVQVVNSRQPSFISSPDIQAASPSLY